MGIFKGIVECRQLRKGLSLKQKKLNIKISSVNLILLVSLFITLVSNKVFFSKATERLGELSLGSFGFILAVYCIVFLVLVFIQFVLGQKYFLKPVMGILLILSAGLSYFMQEIGIIFDVDMVRNIVETIKDNNQQEATELLSLSLIKHVFLFGVLPVILLSVVQIRYKTFSKELVIRLLYLLGIIGIVVFLLLANFKFISYFARENRDLRVYITPLYAIDSIKGYVRSEQRKNKMPYKIIGGDAIQKKTSKQRTIGIMVVGETARADHFSLNGYQRETNPKLRKESILNYQKVSSCGTSTAYSVPCMFSFLNRDNYSPEKAERQSNVLDVLEKADIEVIWLDNNSSCKGVCKRTGEINLRQNPDKESAFYSDGEEFDEALIAKMDEQFKTLQPDKDVLFVLHTLGSHGPKYYKRYPEAFSQFEPACKHATPQECTDKEIINAYDNSILYTDYVLSQLINYLKTQENTQQDGTKNSIESFLIYASDHGESLGEKGVYLHGLPYFIAPKAQTHIPMMMWLSEAYQSNHALEFNKLKQYENIDKISHDNLSHSLLGAFEVQTELYKSDYDLLR